MWMAKKEEGTPLKFFLWQQLNRSSCPGQDTGRGDRSQFPLFPRCAQPWQKADHFLPPPFSTFPRLVRTAPICFTGRLEAGLREARQRARGHTGRVEAGAAFLSSWPVCSISCPSPHPETSRAKGFFPAITTCDPRPPSGREDLAGEPWNGALSRGFLRAPTWVELGGQRGHVFLLRRLCLQGELICGQQQGPPLRAAGQQALFGQQIQHSQGHRELGAGRGSGESAPRPSACFPARPAAHTSAQLCGKRSAWSWETTALFHRAPPESQPQLRQPDALIPAGL